METVYIVLAIQIPIIIYYIYREVAWWKWQKTFMDWVRNDYTHRNILTEKIKQQEDSNKLFCGRCHIELTEEDDKFKCPKCGKEYQK